VGFDGPAIVSAASESLTMMLRTLDEQAWDRPAAEVGWTCRATMEHVGGVFAHYAGQVASNPADHYVAFGFDLWRADTHDKLVEAIETAGQLLQATVQVAPQSSRSWHPQGQFTRNGFAAIAACEALVHGHDIATGLGSSWLPDDALSGAALAALFPDALVHAEHHAPNELLLWATGRLSLPGLPRTESWNYCAAAAL
jgi:uncharacterized protein (TIGR03083 family)